jgi:membrane-associated phospholipid phosphatase
VIFTIAFALDSATGNRWTSIWGRTAILLSLGTIFPAIRSWLLASISYVSVWTTFNVARAVADAVPWSPTRLGLVRSTETSLANGYLPTVWLQEALFTPGGLGWHDGFATLVYLSYFVVPHGVALWLMFRDRTWFYRYLLATGLVFIISALGFALLPTNPPWRAVEEVRIVPQVIATSPARDWLSTTGGSGYAFDPNPVASWPSVHLAITVILALIATGKSRSWAGVGMTYAILMAAPLVYLGEHYVIDIVARALAAIVAWGGSVCWFRPPHRVTASPTAPSAPQPMPGMGRQRRSGSSAGAPRTA